MSNEFMSLTITKLVPALSKAQSKIKGALEKSLNPHFKSKYADLESIWEACKDALVENEFCVSQIVSIESEKPILITLLLHSSGEWLKSCMPLLQTKPDIQGLGSALTYCRRYSLASILCCCTVEDDDGEKARQSEERSIKKEEIKRKQEMQRKNPSTFKDLCKALENMNCEFEENKLKEYVRYCAEKRDIEDTELFNSVLMNDTSIKRFHDYFLDWMKKNSQF